MENTNTTAILPFSEKERNQKDRLFSTAKAHYAGEARDVLYTAFALTYSERLLRAIFAVSSQPQTGEAVVFETIATVGFSFKHPSFGQIVMPIVAPRWADYTLHYDNLYRVEQAILKP
jgi:hypothetical protein